MIVGYAWTYPRIEMADDDLKAEVDDSEPKTNDSRRRQWVAARAHCASDGKAWRGQCIGACSTLNCPGGPRLVF
jgi:hypothetical protein